ncbi:MAG: ATP-dependent metallopeptidase FtsH/Yme1/Tma family protein [candidate division Zixibacteria bacterium]|nr:ATP-dependent metallopeptidase FtsH/Yme1/Tma family protein [candidate division Zixibacteria bacterium]
MAVLLFYQVFVGGNQDYIEVNYTEFIDQIKADNVVKAVFIDKEIKGEFLDTFTKTVNGRTVTGKKFRSRVALEDRNLIPLLQEHKVIIEAETSQHWGGLLITALPWLILVFWMMFMLRQMQGGGPKGLFSFGKSRAKLLTGQRVKVTFNDVAGADEAKQELQEIIEFLKDPAKFQKLGGKIPKGALLLGPPGSGKTLMARAVAGEAGVPFFSMSGSDFVEMFVGVGASRVRDLFEQGKKNAPCIIFIDEIDAVGRHRGAGLGGGHDEREQTLNQLLVEMDGFESNEGVILLAATNRPDVLDPALLRPGRFDRQIVVDQPDVKGREGILKVHIRKINIHDKVDMKVLARGTPGLSGADLANLVNEAALLAARKNHDHVMMDDFEEAKDKVMMGTERRSMVISPEEKKTTAYHEAGHALVGKLIPGSDPIHKVTIIPRGMALGVTHYLPVDEKHNLSKDYLEIKLVHLLGGRVAELLIFDQLTTGAGNDLEQATNLARKMVCNWGMSDKIGPLTFGKKQEHIFLGKEISQARDYSEQTALEIDSEIKKIVVKSLEKAEELLSRNTDKLHVVAQALLEKECLTGEQIDDILEEFDQAEKVTEEKD